MPLYSYACACGNRQDLAYRMGGAPKGVRCRTCGGMLRRVFTVPAVRTETTLSDSVRRSYAAAGYKVGNWGDVKRLEKEQSMAIVNRHDLDIAERRQGKEADDLIADAQRRIDDANRITVRTRTKPRRKSRVA